METARKYQDKIDWSGNDRATCNAVNLAIFMIVDVGINLKSSVRAGAKKYNITQSYVEKIVREIFPKDYFSARCTAFSPVYRKSPADRVNHKHMQSICAR